MQTLRVGSRGLEVIHLQRLLTREGYPVNPDGVFGPMTETAVRNFQRSQHLVDDGIVGPITWRALGDGGVIPPPFQPLSGYQRMELFGRFTWTPNPAHAPGQEIAVGGTWVEDNIVAAVIPQLAGVPWYSRGGKKCTGVLRMHRKAAPIFQRWFSMIEEANKLSLVLTIDGLYCARYIRGSKTSISNHAYGTAIDINAAWNGFGDTPAPLGTEGSVYGLVEYAHKAGLYWGGNFTRRDGMHFEVARL